MKDRCLKLVSQALGRELTKAEADAIDQKVIDGMKRVATANREKFRTMSTAERLQAGAEWAGKNIVSEAELQKRRVELTVNIHKAANEYIDTQAATGMHRLDALERMVRVFDDGKSNTLSIETLAKSIRDNSLRQMVDTLTASDPRFMGLFEDPESVKALAGEIFGEDTGNARAKAGAKAWKEVAEQLKKEHTDFGGKIGHLEDWNIVSHHSQVRVLKAGPDAWIKFLMDGRLKREKYVHNNGELFNDEELVQFLKSAWAVIASDGATDGEASFGRGMLANRRAAHREIHFANSTAYLEYQGQFGDRSIWGTMVGHVQGLSKDIAALRVFGPNAEHNFKELLAVQKQKEANNLQLISDPEKRAKAMGKLASKSAHLQNMFDYSIGNTKEMADVKLAQGFDTLRNNMVASRLGSSAITAITDQSSLQITAAVNNIPQFRMALESIKELLPGVKTDRKIANSMALGLEALTSHLARWGQDQLGPSYSSLMASTVMRASGLEALDNGRRIAFGRMMYSTIGRLVSQAETLGKLHKGDNRILLSKGITETDWAIWRMAEQVDDGRGGGLLTPGSIQAIDNAKLEAHVAERKAAIEADRAAKLAGIDKAKHAMGPEKTAQAIEQANAVFDKQLAAFGSADRMKNDAILRLLGAVIEETDMAVVRPGNADRVLAGAASQRGTWGGEIYRTFFLFKSFPLAMIRKHFSRGWGMETAGGRATYIASTVIATTMLGALAMTLNDLASGKNPRNFAGDGAGKNWIAAMLKGGSLGLYGDFLFSFATQSGRNSPVASLLGPAAGMAEQALDLSWGNIMRAAKGQKTTVGADLVQFVKGNTPGASLWWAKAALDHLIFQQAQEYVSPGYSRRVENRARKEFNQTYWWVPGTGPKGITAPNIGAIGGN